MMKTLVFLAAFLFQYEAASQHLILITHDGTRESKFLYCRYKNELIKVRELQLDEDFRGFDLIDSSHVFFAFSYWSSGGFSISIMSFDLASKKESFLGAIMGVAADDWIDYSQFDSMLVFTKDQAIRVAHLPHLSDQRSELIIDIHQSKLVLNVSKEVIPFWISKGEIGYLDVESGITSYATIR